MFGERRVSALVCQYAADHGFPVISVCQPAHLFRKDVERRLSRVALPCDPWQARLAPERFSLFDWRYGVGATPDEAVLAAIPRDLKSALSRCEVAVDNLRDCLQKLLREEN
jgi:hypothetical protein